MRCLYPNSIHSRMHPKHPNLLLGPLSSQALPANATSISGSLALLARSAAHRSSKDEQSIIAFRPQSTDSAQCFNAYHSGNRPKDYEPSGCASVRPSTSRGERPGGQDLQAPPQTIQFRQSAQHGAYPNHWERPNDIQHFQQL